jgi:hypothetical protein
MLNAEVSILHAMIFITVSDVTAKICLSKIVVHYSIANLLNTTRYSSLIVSGVPVLEQEITFSGTG